MVDIARFASEIEARHLSSVLAEHGIDAFVQGSATSSALSYVGSAIGEIRLQTAAEDATRALAVLSEHRLAKIQSDAAWYCGSCQVEVDPGFEVCWNCGRDRAEIQGPFPPLESSVVEDDGGKEGEAPVRLEQDPSNPYATPRTHAPNPATSSTKDVKEQEEDPRVEQMLEHAYRAAVIGFVVFPFLVHAYSMYLLIRAAVSAERFTPRADRLWTWTFVLNVLAAFYWLVFLSLALRF